MLRLSIGLIAACAFAAHAVADEDTKRRIEEVVVTAEKVESTVSDTSISITALGTEMIEDLGFNPPMSLLTTQRRPETATTFESVALVETSGAGRRPRCCDLLQRRVLRGRVNRVD